VTFLLLFSCRNFSEVWSRLASAFDVDRLLKRTCLYAFPVWRLPSTGMFHISDLCVALVEFFPRGFGDKEEVIISDYFYALITKKCVTFLMHTTQAIIVEYCALFL